MEGMKRFIGTKIIHAKPMTLGDYNKHRGWTIPENEDSNRPGHLVQYPDGYQSWSPAEAFKSYRPVIAVNYGMALEGMRLGYLVARAGWIDQNVYAYFVEGTNVPVEKLRGMAAVAVASGNNKEQTQTICGHIDLVDSDGSIIVGWQASFEDQFADDWIILG